MNGKALFVGTLMLALCGAIAVAGSGGVKETAGPAGGCPMHVAGAKVSVVNIDSGVVIHVTGGDAESVAKIQAAAAGLGGGESSAKAGCKHCSGHGAAAPAPAGAKAGVWACPMGDYSGPRTKDGRCPKCGMNLSEKK